MDRFTRLLTPIFLTFVAVSVLAGDELSEKAKREKALSALMATNRKAFPNVPEISLSELEKLQATGSVILVDVRDEKERKVSMIPGAIAVETFERTKDSLKEKLVVPYCTVGYRSAKYAKSLIAQDIAAKNFNGSIIAWCHADKMLIGPDGKETRRVHTYGPKWSLLPPEYIPVW